MRWSGERRGERDGARSPLFVGCSSRPAFFQPTQTLGRLPTPSPSRHVIILERALLTFWTRRLVDLRRLGPERVEDGELSESENGCALPALQDKLGASPHAFLHLPPLDDDLSSKYREKTCDCEDRFIALPRPVGAPF